MSLGENVTKAEKDVEIMRLERDLAEAKAYHVKAEKRLATAEAALEKIGRYPASGLTHWKQWEADFYRLRDIARAALSKEKA